MPARLIVDGNNVMGSRPDGWWKDRAGATRRLVERIGAWADAAGTDVLVVFARTGPGAGSKGLSAFVVDAAAPGFRVERQIALLAPHPIGQLGKQESPCVARHALAVTGHLHPLGCPCSVHF